MYKSIIVFAFVFVQSLHGQDRVKERLAGLSEARDRQGFSVHLDVITRNKLLASAIGVDKKQLESMNEFSSELEEQWSELSVNKYYKAPPSPPAPDLTGLSKEERRQASREYRNRLFLHEDAVDIAEDEHYWNRKNLKRRIRAEYSDSLEDVLTDDQKVRYGQMILQSQLGQNRPLGVYFNPSLQDWVRLTPGQFEDMQIAAKAVQETLSEDIQVLLEKYHRQIRQVISERRREAIAATLKPGRDDLDDEPTKFSQKILESEYLKKFHFRNVCTLFGNHPKVNGQELATYLSLVDDQRFVIRDLLADLRRGYSANAKEWSVSGRDAWLKSFDDQLVEEILLPYQVRRLAQQVAMTTLNDPRPFGIYSNEEFQSLFDLSRSEFSAISNRSKEVYPKFLNELTKKLKDAHDQVRSEMPESVKNQLDEVLGEPYLLSMVRKKPFTYSSWRSSRR